MLTFTSKASSVHGRSDVGVDFFIFCLNLQWLLQMGDTVTKRFLLWKLGSHLRGKGSDATLFQTYCDSENVVVLLLSKIIILSLLGLWPYNKPEKSFRIWLK